MTKELPENWKFTTVKEISSLVRGVSYKKNDAKEIKENDDFLILRGGNIQDGKIVITEKEVFVKSSLVRTQQELQIGDVIIVGSTGSKKLIGKAAIVTDKIPETAFGAFLMLIRPNELIVAKYFDYYFISEDYRKKIRELAGGININNIRRSYIEDLKFPLPPIAEQERIVDKLDDLFGRLDKIKASLAKIPELLQNFRQQVLTQAVTGKLTKRMNKNSSIKLSSPITIEKLYTESPKNWKWIKLTELAKLESGHTPRKSKPEYWENGNIPWISLQDIRKAHGKIISETKFMPNENGIKNSSARLLPKGTVCFSRDISVGFTTIMGREMSTTQHFANWICNDAKLLNTYLLYSFMAAKNHLTSSGQGTTVKTIYMPALKKLHLLLPPIKEQQEIVYQVESLFAKADIIQEKYELLKAKIEHLPQAILHKAFKGELVPQLESDGDARELLREIEGLKRNI